MWRWLRLPVLRYALPALVAIGFVRHTFAPSRNRIARIARRLARERALSVGAVMRLESGGFLEATPIRSFVATTLAVNALASARHAVERGAAWLLAGTDGGTRSEPRRSDSTTSLSPRTP